MMLVTNKGFLFPLFFSLSPFSELSVSQIGKDVPGLSKNKISLWSQNMKNVLGSDIFHY